MVQLSPRSRRDQKSVLGRALDSMFYDHNSYLSAAHTMDPEDFDRLTKRESGSVSHKAILFNIAVLGGILTLIGLLAIFRGSLGGIIALSFGCGIVIGIAGLLLTSQSPSSS
ncbi:MAG: hypothetical protein ORO03_06260 [Alphaproteobacteria bacterium]|nr:hypothetical protein [Alphaproteobacteria bacterium]